MIKSLIEFSAHIQRESLMFEGLNVRCWPLFQDLPIMPTGINDKRRGLPWPENIVDWWPEDHFFENVQAVRKNIHYEDCRPPVDTFNPGHITRGARETAWSLSKVRGDLDKTLAVLFLAWTHRGSRERDPYKMAGPVWATLNRWRDQALDLLKEGERPRYDTKNSRTLPIREDSDPVTYVDRFLDTDSTMTRAFINDAWLSQTRIRLVSLSPDPNFSVEAFEASERIRIQAVREAHEAEQRAWQDRVKAQEEAHESECRAWIAELDRRKQRSEQYQRAKAIPLNGTMVGFDSAAKHFGVSPSTLRRWASVGLSVEQMPLLKSKSKGIAVDGLLIRLGVIEGVQNSDIPHRVFR